MFDTSLLMDALQISLQGMIGIFAFMVVFYLSIMGIDKLFPKKIEK